MIITIDGVAWSGKSTMAKALSRLLNFSHLNTGVTYKIIAYNVLKQNIGLEEKEKIINIAKNTSISFKKINNINILVVDGKELKDQLSSLPESILVPITSKIAQIPEVREILVSVQRRLAKDLELEGGVIVEGRDTGSVIFPNADFKFYIDASIEIRIKRFYKDASKEEKNKYSNEEARKIIEETDFRDKNRETSPLKIPENAIIYDNSDSPTAEQDAVVLWYYITHKKEIIENTKSLKKKI